MCTWEFLLLIYIQNFTHRYSGRKGENLCWLNLDDQCLHLNCFSVNGEVFHFLFLCFEAWSVCNLLVRHVYNTQRPWKTPEQVHRFIALKWCKHLEILTFKTFLYILFFSKQGSTFSLFQIKQMICLVLHRDHFLIPLHCHLQVLKAFSLWSQVLIIQTTGSQESSSYSYNCFLIG